MFNKELNKLNWQDITNNIYSKTTDDVETALQKEEPGLNDFQALISPSATPYLEEMAHQSRELTQKRFGKTIQLFIPLYLSNLCENECVYCGFNKKNKIHRKILSNAEILAEVEILKEYGYKHILLVSGECPSKAGVNYLKHVIRLIKPFFSLISIEVQALNEKDYKELINEGLNTVYIYQETYHKEKYNKYHLSGKKSDFQYRLETPDRLGKAGIYKIGIGNLIGLEDWRTEAFFTAFHLKYLNKQYWKTKYSISFPRLRPFEGQPFQPNIEMSDKELVQLICAYRILDENVELSMSVRESPKFRDNIMKIGITSMSAGSRTEPGGYSNKNQELKQFEVHDNRTPSEIASMISINGYEAVWKDWDTILQM